MEKSVNNVMVNQNVNIYIFWLLINKKIQISSNGLI